MGTVGACPRGAVGGEDECPCSALDTARRRYSDVVRERRSGEKHAR